mmetsp:Transcript_31827/g.62364  ORF Transcript_31827/g.62364 Transcript_31827/m.62364 type:complete len:721 (-) Transcript_31827:1158-3320(-)
MGRKSRHSAKTGDKSIYKSRPATSSHRDDDDSDQDPMYNEVERHYNRKQRQEEEFLQLDQEDGPVDSDEEEDDGITTNREGVFDLGIGGSSEEEDDDGSESDENENEKARLNRRQAPVAASSSEDDDEDSESDDDGEDEAGGKSKVLNWGTKKSDYYHGDTADLEIGQDVEDAYLEEVAGREVEKARLGVMEDEDFMLDGGDEAGSAEEGDSDEEEELKKPSKKKRKESMHTAAPSSSKTEIQSIQKNKQNLRKLSKKDQLKFIQSQHPELLPLLTHFRGPVEEFAESTLVAGGALLKGLGGGGGIGKEAEAVGATVSGLRYLITKSMLQASKALNLSLYLLLKEEKLSRANDDRKPAELLGDMTFMDDDEGDDIRNHPVIDRLNQLSKLTDKLSENVECKVSGLKDQLNSLVKAAALMEGGDVSSDSDTDDDEEGKAEEASTESSEIKADDASDDSVEQPQNDRVDSSSSEIDDEELESQDAIQRQVMNEARFALRNQDIEHDVIRSKKRRRLAPMISDYGDETEEVSEKAMAAGRKLASTMNSITQKSSKKGKALVGDEEGEGDDDYERLQRGLSMMEEEFGEGSSDEGNEDGSDGELDDEGLGDEDDEFYHIIKSKSKAKKAAKKAMYAVAPKYPRLEDDVEGERAIGRSIMKNRGLVAHKPKINRNPRVKKREQYRKALIRRKGAVREVRTEEGHVYGGEATGIKSGISRSRKLTK